jgi:glycosyltransferase involved in cell wall biosynthesis
MISSEILFRHRKQDESMALKPEVTVGFCVKNCDEFIEETLNSVYEQNYPHALLELVFVDDGSKDKTLDVVSRFVPEMGIPAKMFHTSWKGLGHARNLVVANAAGEYILWVDGDMLLSKNFISELVAFIKEHPEMGIVKGKQSLIPGGNLLSTLETYSRAASRMVNYQDKNAPSQALGTGGAIYRVDAAKQVGGFDENLRGYGEDWDIELRFRNAGWSLCAIPVEFSDYERFPMSWNRLWCRYWLRGYYSHYFLHKNAGLLKLLRMFPLLASVNGLIYARKVFAITKQKIVFLLPFEHFFKMSAWYVGFVKSHLKSYQPNQ